MEMLFFVTRRLVVIIAFLMLNGGVGAIQVTAPEQIVNYAGVKTITGLGYPYANLDGPLSSYISHDGHRYWLMPYNYNDGVYLARTKAWADQGFDNLVGDSRERWGQWDIFLNPLGYPGRWWVVSIYQIQASSPLELLAFVHVECWDAVCNGLGHGGIGVAYYKEGYNDNKFSYLGSVITAKNFPDNFNIQGAPYIVKDGFIYIYYSDRDDAGHPHVAVARVGLDQLISAARGGQPSPSWSKYYNGQWSQSGIDGDFSGLSQIPGYHIVHSGAAYSSYTKKYYLTTYVNANQPSAFQGWPVGNGVFLFDSVDGINWSFQKTLYWAGVPPQIPGSSLYFPGFEYVSVVSTDPGAWGNGVVGDSFHVYAVFNDGAVDEKIRVYRMSVNLESSDCLGGASGCGF